MMWVELQLTPADSSFAPSYLGNEFKLQDGWQMLLGYNEPGE